MKLKVIALLILAVSVPAANAAYNPSEAAAATQQINQGLNQIKDAQAPNQKQDGQNNINAGIGRIEAMTGGTYVGSTTTAPAQPERNTAADAHSYAATAARAYNAALTAAKYASVNQVANQGIKNDPTGTPVAQGPVVNATAYREGITQQQQKTVGVAPAQVAVSNPAQSINVAASALHPDTPVSVSIDGVAHITTAGALAAVDPSIQISVPHIAAFQRTAVKGGSNNDHSHSSHVQGDNNGGSNSHAHAMGARGQAGQRSGKSAAGNF